MPPNSIAPPLQQPVPGHPVHPDLFLFNKSWQGMLDAKPHSKKTRGARTAPPAEAAHGSQHPPQCLPAQGAAPKPSSLRHEAKIQLEISTLNLLIHSNRRTDTPALVLSSYPLTHPSCPPTGRSFQEAFHGFQHYGPCVFPPEALAPGLLQS